MNTFLRRARLQTNLTQEELASALGTTAVSIWRWERGGKPSPFFREAICDYFHLSPAELGWPSQHGSARMARGSPLPSLIDPLIPDPCGSPFMSQQTLLAQVQELLCVASGPRRVGLIGLAGSGKTAVLRQLATAPEIQKAFAGVLWASLGPESHPLCHLQRWADLLSLGPLPTSLRDAQDLLRTAIGQRRILFVLDDAWAQTDVAPLWVGGPACRYVVTTRQPGLARLLCQEVLPIHDLTEDEAFALLVADFPGAVVREHTPTFQHLLRSVGKLPLALVLMREYLRREAYMQPPRRFHEALRSLAQRGKYQAAPDFFQIEMPWHAHSLSAAIQQSEAGLPSTARAALRLLANQFQDAPFTESEAAAFVLNGHIHQELDYMMDAGLLAWSEHGCYSFHPIIAEYSRLTSSESQQERKLPEACHFSERARYGRSQPLLN